MKKIFSVILITAFVRIVFGQANDDLNTITTTRRISVADAAANDSCTLAADKFVFFVNTALEKLYPAKVDEVIVKLYVVRDSLELRYTASIKPCDKSEAVRKFEHVGIIWLLPRDISARGAAKRYVDHKTNKLASSNAVRRMFYENADAESDDSHIWIVYENFLASSQ